MAVATYSVGELLYLAGAALAAMILTSPAGQQASKQAAQGVANAIDNLAQSAQTKATAVPTTTVQCQAKTKEKTKKKRPCHEIQQDIENVMNELEQRWQEYDADEGNLPATKPSVPDPRYGYRSRAGEQQQYEGKQQRLRNLEEEWNDAGCGPALPGVWKALIRKLPGGSTTPYDKFPPV